MGDDTTATDNVAPETEIDTLAWHGVLAPVGVLSGDKRRFAAGGITNRELPIPMQWVEKSSFGHDGAETVGSIETIEYADDGLIYFTGHRVDNERGEAVAALLESGALRGVSVDLDSVEIAYVNEDGSAFDPAGWLPGEPEPIVEITQGRISAATIVAIPAFQEAYVALGAAGERPTFEEPLVAAAAPAYQMAVEQVQYPADWFLNPEFDKPTPMTITDDGRVFGHIAAWGVCHLGFSQRECVTAPYSQTKYAFYLLKEVLTDQGPLPVGAITLGTGHAPLKMTAAAAMAHYDDTGTVVAFINTGEDKHGIWFAGAIKSGLSAEKVAELRGATLSGDWRPTPYGREFVAALAVNVPGFPVPRVQFAADTHGAGALVAAAVLPPAMAEARGSGIDYSVLAAGVVDEMERRQRNKAERESRLALLRGSEFAPSTEDREARIARLRSRVS